MSSIDLGLSSLVCLAVLTAQPPVPAEAEKITIEGTVLDDSSGLPIERALVTLGPESQFTGPDGRFSFREQSTRRYMAVSAKRPGYESGTPESRTNGERQPVSIRLKRYAEITGTVVNEDGEPIHGLRVQAYRRRIASGRARLSSSSFWTTDDLGHFRLAEMPAGDYLVRVVGRSGTSGYVGEMVARAPGSSEAYLAQFYPGVTEQDAAQVLKMTSGQALKLDFTVVTRPAVSIRGRIVNHASYQAVTLELRRPGELPIGNRVTINAHSGHFEVFDVPRGEYELVAKRTVNGVEERAKAAVQVGTSGLEGIELTLAPAVVVEVHVPKALETQIRHRSSQVVLRATNRTNLDDIETYRQPDESGTIRLQGVWPGSYQIRIRGEFGRHVTSVTSGGVDLLRDLFVVPEGGGVPAPIDVQFGPGVGGLEVAVLLDGKVAPPARVLLFDEGERPTVYDVASSMSGGKVAFPSLAPGSYSILAVPETLELEYENPAVLQKYVNRMKHVTIALGAEQSTEVELVQEIQN